jgi:hypothetical protein
MLVLRLSADYVDRIIGCGYHDPRLRVRRGPPAGGSGLMTPAPGLSGLPVRLGARRGRLRSRLPSQAGLNWTVGLPEYRMLPRRAAIQPLPAPSRLARARRGAPGEQASFTAGGR